MARMRVESESCTSATLAMRLSTLPPTYPAMRPRGMPMAAWMATASTPTVKEMRVP